MAYELTQTEYRNAKTRLTRVLNAARKIGWPHEGRHMPDESKRLAFRNAWQRVKNETVRAAQLFRAEGFPDSWHAWSIAYDDACSALGYHAENPFHG